MSQKDIDKRLNRRQAFASITTMVVVFAICAVSIDMSEVSIKQVLQMMLAMMALWAPIYVILVALADLESKAEERERVGKEMQTQIDALWEASRGQAVAASKSYGPNR